MKRTDRRLTLLLVFAFGGIFGFLYEELFYLIDLGCLVKRGITFGPWIPIYGFGAVLIVLTTDRLRRKPLQVFAVSALACGGLEYITGYMLFHAGGIRLWDYNAEIWNWGNIGGYICARSVLFFGLSALFLLYGIVPLIRRMRESWARNAFYCISVVPAVLFAADIGVSLLTKGVAA